MSDANDMDLVREYAARNSESAFGEIVHRHINLVYSVALRFTGNSEDAQDVTQAVFIILAQKAAGLRPATILTGWLYETTRFTAMRFLRNKTRRVSREQEAYMESILNNADSDNVWRQLSPILEEAMNRLSQEERTLVALRFFENKSVAETAAAFGIQEWAARKRVDRAMEKLRIFFGKRGIVVLTAAIATAISANSVQAAPVALTNHVTTIALAKGVTASASILTLVKGALKLMAWTKVKVIVAAGAAVVVVVTTGTIVIHSMREKETAPPRASSQPQSGFNFENEVTDWMPQNYPGSSACSAVSTSTDQAYEGQYSLKMTLELIGGDAQNGAGEAWAYCGIDRQPQDFTGRTIKAWVYAPAGASGGVTNPNGWQLFVKDDQWHSEYGTLTNIVEGQWIQLSLTVGTAKPDNGWVDADFNPTRVYVVGVKTVGGAGSSYEGPVYVDAVSW